jgi:glutathione S-transferase
MMKLYASPASSFARKIRVMLLEKVVEHDLDIINLWEPNELHLDGRTERDRRRAPRRSGR